MTGAGRIALLALCLLPVLTVPKGAAAAGLSTCAPDRALFVTPEGTVSITVEIADTPNTRAVGLMGRTSLPQGQGMLFIYDQPQQVAFWMKNTLIPLDMLFMDGAGRVRRIHANARPHDETPIPGSMPGDPDPDRQFILEIAGGAAARLGLVPGMAMAHPAVLSEKAALPCR